MKRFISLMMVATLVMLFAGCGQTDTTSKDSQNGSSTSASTASGSSASSQNKKVVGFTLISTSDDFCNTVAEGIKTYLGEKNVECQIASADMDSQKQISQIENFISMKVDGIICMSVEPTSVTDVLKRARAAGIKVFAFTNNPKEYDVFYGGDEAGVGHAICQVAGQWIDKAYADAPDKSVPVATLQYMNTPESAARSKALEDIEKYSKKAKLVKSVETKMDADEATKATENLLMTNPDIKAIVCYNGTLASGVNTCIMAPGSAIKDKSKFGTFCSEVTEQINNYIKQSVENKSVVRGTVNIGGISIDQINKDVAGYVAKMVNGESVPKDIYLENKLVTPENVGK